MFRMVIGGLFLVWCRVYRVVVVEEDFPTQRIGRLLAGVSMVCFSTYGKLTAPSAFGFAH